MSTIDCQDIRKKKHKGPSSAFYIQDVFLQIQVSRQIRRQEELCGLILSKMSVIVMFTMPLIQQSTQAILFLRLLDRAMLYKKFTHFYNQGAILSQKKNSFICKKSYFLTKSRCSDQDFSTLTMQLITYLSNHVTVRPRDTRPQAAWTLQVHVFEQGPKIFELNEFMQ